MEGFVESSISVIAPSSCSLASQFIFVLTTSGSGTSCYWTQSFVMFSLCFKEHKQHLRSNHSGRLSNFNLFGVHVVTIHLDSLQSGGCSYCVIFTNLCNVCVNTKLRTTCMRYMGFTGCQSAHACLPCFLSRLRLRDQLRPCCGWTCLSPLFRNETPVISLAWTDITPSLYRTSFPGLYRRPETLWIWRP